MESIILNTLRKPNSQVSFNSFQHVEGYVGDNLTNFVLQVSQSSIDNSRSGLNQATVLASADRPPKEKMQCIENNGRHLLDISLKLHKHKI